MFDMEFFEKLTKKCQTPFYFFDESILSKRIEHLRQIMPNGVRICYAMKANPFVIGAAGQSADLIEVCSPGELEICRASGVPANKLVISGVFKERGCMLDALSLEPDVHRFTIESCAQFDLLESLARERGERIPVLIRLTSGNQFGIDKETIQKIMHLNSMDNLLDIKGIQFFSGTQKTSAKRVRRELSMLDSLLASIARDTGAAEMELEYGPGIPVDYCEGDAETVHLADTEFVQSLAEALDDMEFSGTKILEIGRGIAASCGAYVTQVVDVKCNCGVNYAIVDGGKHQLVHYGPALALRSPAFEIIPHGNDAERGIWNICGALCSTSDVFVKQAEIPDLKIGEFVVFPNAGAYCMTEGISMFLSRDLPRIYLGQGMNSPPLLVRDRFETARLNMPSSAFSQPIVPESKDVE